LYGKYYGNDGLNWIYKEK